MKCKVCSKEFHHCSSCDPYCPYDNGCCGKNCWEKSDKYKEVTQNFASLIKSLSPIQHELFDKFLEYYDNYESLWDAIWDHFSSDNPH